MLTLPLIILPLPLLMVGATLQIGGLLFSPFAAFYCAWLAKKRKLNIRRYALAGAVHSILVFLPWLYLIRKMQGKPMTAETVRTGFNVVFITWFGILISLGAFLVTPLEGGWPPWRSDFIPAPGAWVVWWTMLVIELISVPCFVVSIQALKRRQAAREQTQPNDTQHAHVSVLVYLAPFAGLAIHILAVSALAGYVFVTTPNFIYPGWA